MIIIFVLIIVFISTYYIFEKNSMFEFLYNSNISNTQNQALQTVKNQFFNYNINNLAIQRLRTESERYSSLNNSIV